MRAVLEVGVEGVLAVAEIPYESGEIRFRYSRHLSSDGTQWVRHGLFVAYYRNGSVASEGEYVHGKEHGLWSSYHDNGSLAARGEYSSGEEIGTWKFWDRSGKPGLRESNGGEVEPH